MMLQRLGNKILKETNFIFSDLSMYRVKSHLVLFVLLSYFLFYPMCMFKGTLVYIHVELIYIHSSQNLNCRSTQISTQAVEQNCRGRNTCIILADNSFLGEDPCPATTKYLYVSCHCLNPVYHLQP